jgi:hypothetical protein
VSSKGGNSNLAKQKRIQWLLEKPELWRGVINPFDPKKHREEIEILARAIHAAGLYSPKTIIEDIRTGVVKLLQDKRLN